MTNRFVLATARMAVLLLRVSCGWPRAESCGASCSHKLEVTNCGAFERRSDGREFQFPTGNLNL